MMTTAQGATVLTESRSAIPSTKTLFGVQLLRGVAALAVLIHHVLEQSEARTTHVPQPLILIGASGVDLFFVISGLIMIYTTIQTPRGYTAAGDFLLRRALRIFPLYWICIAFVLTAHASGYLYKSIATSASRDLAALLLIPIAGSPVGVSWTLSFEIYFYLLFAVTLIIANPKYRSITASVLVASSLVAFRKSSGAGFLINFFGNSITLEFVFGMLLATSATRLPQKLRGRKRINLMVVALGTIGIIVSSVAGPHQGTAGLDSARFLLWGAPAALIVAPLAHYWTVPPSGWLSKFILAMGDASYSIYLTHAIVMTSYAKFLRLRFLMEVPIWLLAVAVLVLAVIVGYLTHRFIEKPINRLIKRKTSPSET